MFLNSRNSYEDYCEMASDPYFVDKSAILKELVPALGRKNKYFCITRPRRFGKSVMANMIAAFFGKAIDSDGLFANLQIAKGEDGNENPDYKRHLNKHNVIYIDFSEVSRDCTNYKQYMERIQDGINKDLSDAYPDLSIHIEEAVWDVLSFIFEKTNEKFIFVMDEWDAIFHLPFIQLEDRMSYLLFLKNLLKGKVYVELAYMTGVLPIAKYSSGSELNMFVEYHMATAERFSEYFGFLDSDVDKVYRIYQESVKDAKISREDLEVWYDGYYTATGNRIYNPRSIVCALTDNQLRNYWTSSGPYDEIFYYIRNNIEDVREDLVLMVAGEGVKADIQNYAAVSMDLNTRDEIYSAMVIYGLLTYRDGKVYIPNRELLEQFKKLLLSKDSLGYVYNLARRSEKMLEATLLGDTKTMTEILQFAHNTESPILSYNSEVELSALVNLVYLSARDQYRVEREDKAGKGYVDFIFYPEQRGAAAMILELKVDSTPDDAIQQIKDKDYALSFCGKPGEQKYTGKILAVGISYNKKTKEHACKVETLRS